MLEFNEDKFINGLLEYAGHGGQGKRKTRVHSHLNIGPLNGKIGNWVVVE